LICYDLVFHGLQFNNQQKFATDSERLDTRISVTNMLLWQVVGSS